MIARRLAVAVGAAAAVLLSACAPPPPVQSASPALWMVRDGGGTVYLIGTLHQLPARVAWDHGPVRAAVRRADALMVELHPDELARAPAGLAKAAARTPPVPLDARLPPAAAQRLNQFAARNGLDMAVLAGLDDWAVALTIGNIRTRAAGLASANGVDRLLIRQFRRRGAAVMGLETATDQFGALDRLSPATQAALLADAAAGIGDGGAELAALLAAWRGGDVAALAQIAAQSGGEYPDFRASLLTDRNRRWTDRILNRGGGHQVVLVAVGAAHLAGPDSLIDMLRARGAAVSRVQ